MHRHVLVAVEFYCLDENNGSPVAQVLQSIDVELDRLPITRITLERESKTKMPTAKARHILVETEEVCEDLKSQIAAGKDFAAIAAEFSACPSGKSGGSLGEFSQGQMVPQFDEVVFTAELNEVHGPVKTQFGYHLIEITERND